MTLLVGAGQLSRLASKAGSEPKVGRYTVTVLVGLGRVGTTGRLVHCDCVGRVGQGQNHWSAATL